MIPSPGRPRPRLISQSVIGNAGRGRSDLTGSLPSPTPRIWQPSNIPRGRGWCLPVSGEPRPSQRKQKASPELVPRRFSASAGLSSLHFPRSLWGSLQACRPTGHSAWYLLTGTVGPTPSAPSVDSPGCCTPWDLGNTHFLLRPQGPSKVALALCAMDISQGQWFHSIHFKQSPKGCSFPCL